MIKYNFTKAIARAKKKQEQEYYFDIQSFEAEYKKQLNVPPQAEKENG